MSVQGLSHPDQPYHCTIPTFKGTSGSHLCSAPTTTKSILDSSSDQQKLPGVGMPPPNTFILNQTTDPDSPEVEFTRRGVFQVHTLQGAFNKSLGGITVSPLIR